MTRRSFCFLFGAGIAAAALPVPVFATGGMIRPSLDNTYASEATFTSRYAPPIGTVITISYGAGVVFSGTVDRIDIHSGRIGHIQAHAVGARHHARYDAWPKSLIGTQD